MPHHGHTATRVSPWHRCDRCGYDYRVTALRRQLGLILCFNCVDDTIAWQRPLIIEDILNFSSPEELRVADILTENSDDDTQSIFS